MALQRNIHTNFRLLALCGLCTAGLSVFYKEYTEVNHLKFTI